jgi:hypothetical protein
MMAFSRLTSNSLITSLHILIPRTADQLNLISKRVLVLSLLIQIAKLFSSTT